jgi:putative superfamily III holin-X
VAFTEREQPAAQLVDGADRNGRAEVNGTGRSRADPAHGGPIYAATFAELIGRLINDVSELADKQVELAKQEVNEAKDHAIDAVKRLAIGAGVLAACGLLLVIWLWTAVIWFFNWVGSHISIGSFDFGWIGWPIGLLLPVAIAWFIGKRYISNGLTGAKTIWPPLPRTRATLKEDLEWVRDQRTRSTR